MNSPTGRQIVLAARPNGQPKLTDFRLEEIAVPTPSPGQILVGVQYLSLDPYMRGRMDDRKSYAKPLQIGAVMIGEAVAQVIASNHPDYWAGEIVSPKLDGAPMPCWILLASLGFQPFLMPAISTARLLFASLTPPRHQRQPPWACWACLGSPLTPASD